jgi:hypothetical protein
MSSSTSPSVPSSPTLPTQSFHLDVPLHNLLQKDPSPTLARVEHQPRTSLALPSPVFPQHPALLHKIYDADIAAHQGVLAGLRRK